MFSVLPVSMIFVGALLFITVNLYNCQSPEFGSLSAGILGYLPAVSSLHSLGRSD